MMENSYTHIQPLEVFGGPKEDKSKNIIKVIGVGGGGCNAVRNMYKEGIVNVTFAVCNTDSQSLSKSPIPVKIQLGDTGLGAGANPEIGRKSAETNRDEIEQLLDDGTKMVFITAGMGGGTGTGAAPVIAGIAKEKGILTIGIITIPFFFEKKSKIIKALKGVENMRKNVDALLIINNERICDIYAESKVTIKDALKRADQILSDATKSISELITVEGDINLDFCDVESTLRNGGGAIMAMGRADGEHRVEKAIINALDSPLLYGNDIDKAKRILFNIYTSESHPLYVNEMNEIDVFMDALNPNIEVIWGVSDDNTLDEDAKVTILATGFEDQITTSTKMTDINDDDRYEKLISELYKPYKKRIWHFEANETEECGTQEESLEEPTENIIATNTLADNIEGITFSVSVGDNEPDEYNIPEENTEISDATTTISTEPEKDTIYNKVESDAPEGEYHTSDTTSNNNQPTNSHRPLSFVERAKKLMDKFSELTQDPE